MKKKIWRWHRLIIAIILLFLIVNLIVLDFVSQKPVAPVITKTFTRKWTNEKDPNRQICQTLNSKYAKLINFSDKKILCEKNSQQQMAPASLTKILTAITILDNNTDLDKKTTVPYDIYPEIYAQNASVAGFQPNETFTTSELLYGLILPSGADAAKTLALINADSEDQFAQLMNEEAMIIGMYDSHFMNASGLDQNKHYTTADNLVKLLEYALENPTFKKIFTTQAYDIPKDKDHKKHKLRSTMSYSLKKFKLKNTGILGSKTGYTFNSGLSFASLLEKDGKEYILVTAHADGDGSTKPNHIIDALNVIKKLQ